MAVCSVCGREISSEMMFCPYCGTKRHVDTSGRPIDVPSEKMIDIVPYVKGFGPIEGDWTLFVTDSRLIFVHNVDQTMPKSSSIPGLSILSIRGPDSGEGVTYAQKYHEMTIETILKEDERHVQMWLRSVQLVRLGQADETHYRVDLTKDGDVFSFTMPMQHEHRDAFLNVLGEKVVW